MAEDLPDTLVLRPSKLKYRIFATFTAGAVIILFLTDTFSGLRYSQNIILFFIIVSALSFATIFFIYFPFSNLAYIKLDRKGFTEKALLGPLYKFAWADVTEFHVSFRGGGPGGTLITSFRESLWFCVGFSLMTGDTKSFYARNPGTNLTKYMFGQQLSLRGTYGMRYGKLAELMNRWWHRAYQESI